MNVNICAPGAAAPGSAPRPASTASFAPNVDFTLEAGSLDAVFRACTACAPAKTVNIAGKPRRTAATASGCSPAMVSATWATVRWFTPYFRAIAVTPCAPANTSAVIAPRCAWVSRRPPFDRFRNDANPAWPR